MKTFQNHDCGFLKYQSPLELRNTEQPSACTNCRLRERWGRRNYSLGRRGGVYMTTGGHTLQLIVCQRACIWGKCHRWGKRCRLLRGEFFCMKWEQGVARFTLSPNLVCREASFPSLELEWCQGSSACFPSSRQRRRKSHVGHVNQFLSEVKIIMFFLFIKQELALQRPSVYYHPIPFC